MNLEKVNFGYLENQLNERLENLGKWNVDINDEDNKYLFQSDDKELLELLFDEDFEVEDNG